MTHVMRIAFVALCLFGASPSFAQAGGEVVDVKVTHVVSSIGAPTPPDEIQQLRLRVVDARGHEFTAAFGSDATSACANLLNPRSGRVDYCSTELKGPDAARRWLAGGEERRLLLIDLYISMFQQLDEGVARGRIASTNARIDPSKAQGYVTLADIAAVVKARTAKAEAQQAESAAKDEQARAAISKPKLLPIPEPVIADPAGRSTIPEPAVKKCDTTEPPVVLQRVEPKYSEEARKARYQGTVVLGVIIRKDGTVDIQRIVRSIGFGLDENAIQALKQWRFRPGMCNGVPVDVSLNIEVNFHRPGTK